LRGRDGTSKSLVQRSWETARSVSGVDAVYIATDDDRIAEAAQGFGAEVVMTSPAARNGTERCAEAIANLALEPEIVVNLQGDAPLTPPWFVEDLIRSMQSNAAVRVATPVLRCDIETYGNFVTDRQNGRVGGTTAVFDKNMRALYFSKEVLPYLPKAPAQGEPVPVFHHVGVYAYRPQALRDYAGYSEGTLEGLEGLEQLRFMENGIDVHCVEVEARGRVFWELNNPIDVERIVAVL
jgi:3-deoxy-manno-octulosonate cytidylyltransferase (CMP-KDO synthetase)